MKVYFKLWSILLVMALAVLVIVTLTFQPAHAAGPWYVAPGGDDNLNDCLSDTTPCATINGALGKADPGDTIFVATGTYTGTGSEVVWIDMDKDITLSGGWDASFTTQNGTSTIDGQGSRGGIAGDWGVTAIVERFTVQNCSGSGISVGDALILNDSIVKNNTAGYSGGGINGGNSVTLNNSTISGNTAGIGGGISANIQGSTVTLNNSTVSGNTATSDDGGGIYGGTTLILNNSTVSGNTADGDGGGIGTHPESLIIITNTQIYANTAGNDCDGGGIKVNDDSHLSMSRSRVVGNVGSDDGGGIAFDDGGSANIENSIIAGNSSDGSGGGFRFNSGGPYRIVNSNIVGNETSGDGAAIAASNSYQVEVINTLIISNTGITGIDGSGSVFQLNYCDTYGNSPDGTISVTINRTNCLGSPTENGLDPLMSGGVLPGGVGPAFAAQWMSYDYNLQTGSPAINAGNNTACPATDLRGVPRPQGTTCDIGAYEAVEQSGKTVNRSAALPGDPLTYSVIFLNESATVTNVRITDTLPISLAYVDNSLTANRGSYGYNNGTITWTGSVSASDFVTVGFETTISEAIPPGASITNSAVISGGGELVTYTAIVNINTPIYLPVMFKNQ